MAADEEGARPAASEAPGDEADAEAQVQQLLQYAEQVRMELAAVEEQRTMLSEVLTDYRRGRDALKALRDGAGEADVLVPLGGSNYLPATITLDARKVLTGIGSGVHVESDVEKALERLDAREESASKARARMDEEARKLSDEMNRLNQHLQALSMGGAGPGE